MGVQRENAMSACAKIVCICHRPYNRPYNRAMQIRKGYKYRLKTNRTTGAQFVRFAGACRFVWNKILALNEGRYLAGVPRLSYNDAAALVAWWKESEEYGWLKNVHSQALQQCLQDLERAYANL